MVLSHFSVFAVLQVDVFRSDCKISTGLDFVGGWLKGPGNAFNLLLFQELLAHGFIGLEADLTPKNSLKQVKRPAGSAHSRFCVKTGDDKSNPLKLAGRSQSPLELARPDPSAVCNRARPRPGVCVGLSASAASCA